VPVSFSPTAPGSASGLLSFVAGAANDHYDFSLHGTGTQDGLSADPAAVAFGSVSTSASSQLGVTIQNTGTSNATITAIKLPPAPFTVTGLPAVGATLAPQGSVTATILFKPTVQKDYLANLKVTANTGIVTVHLTGTGVAGSPKLTLDPPILDFGGVQPGANRTLTFTVTNTGDATLTITKAAPPSAPFVVATPLSEGQAVSPGDKLTVSVKFAPTTAMPVTDHYSITGNDGQGAQLVTVMGNTQPPVGAIASPLTCLAVKGDVQALGTPIVGLPCDGSAGEQFSLGSSQSVHLGGATSPWCLDIQQSGVAPGTPVQLWDCNTSVAQQWTWRNDNTLYNAHSGLCLDLPHSSTTPNTAMWIFTCNKTDAQYWNFSPLQSARGAVSSGLGAANQVCMQDHGGATANNTPIEIAPCTLSAPQIFTAVGNTLRVLGQCVTTNGNTSGTKIRLYRCTAGSSQRWIHRADGTLFNTTSGRCLGVPGGVATPGLQLQLLTCNTSAAERWNVPG
jgi:hypothetical protein